MHTSMSEFFGGVTPNPLADAFCGQHDLRIEALADLLWPSVELDKPHGVEISGDDGKYRPATDDESRTLQLSILEKFTTVGDGFEEQAARGLEAAAAKLQELAGRIRGELVK